MDVRAEFRQVGEGGDKVVAVADRVRGGEANALDFIDGVHGFEQLDKGRLAVDFRELGAAVKVDDLAEQGDFLHAVGGELADFGDDLGDRAAAFFTAGVGHDAEGATHVAALHDRNKGGGFVRLWHMVADGVLRTFLLGGVANACSTQGIGRVVHPGFEPPLEDRVDVFEDLVVLLGADDHVEIRQRFEKLFATRLGHAAHEAVNDVFPVAALVDQVAHFAERLLLCLVADRAGVDQNGVGFVFVAGDRVAAFAEHPRDLFRVAFVHLAAVRFDVDFRHGKKCGVASAELLRPKPDVRRMRAWH